MKQDIRWRPFLLTGALLVADQIIKAFVVAGIPRNTVAWSFGGDFFRLVHVRNLGMAFSLGAALPDIIRKPLLIVLPLIVMVFVAWYILKGRDLSTAQRWFLAGILGGGMGNVVVDRIFRPAGVVDYLDFKFYGLFGLERWPVFNLADASVVVCGILLMISFFLEKGPAREQNT